jgi:hypothetical protein
MAVRACLEMRLRVALIEGWRMLALQGTVRALIAC